jgi:superfamily II DNA or RNA helicase
VTTVLQDRGYQTECNDAVWNDLRGGLRRVAVVLPTGMGKTVILSRFVQRYRSVSPLRVVILVHRDELVSQTVDKLLSVDRTLDVGVVKAARNDVAAQVIVASIQTLASSRRLWQLASVGLVIVDECHHAPSKTYMDVLEHFGCFTSTGAVAVGFTATMTRADSKGLGDVWEKVSYTKDIEWGIRHKFLCDVRAKAIKVDVDLSGADRLGLKDYSAEDLGKLLGTEQTADAIVSAYQDYAPDRSGILFAPTVATTWQFAEALSTAGFSAEVVTGKTPLAERRDIYARSRAGDTRVICNAMVLTEGFDAPWISCGVIARPTKHVGLYMQMTGRILRPWPGKADALLLDVAGVTRRHRLASLADLSKTRIGGLGDLSLMEAFEGAESAEADEFLESDDPLDAELGWEDVDVFGRTSVTWRTTYGGTPFVRGGTFMWFLIPDPAVPGLWKVGESRSKYLHGGGYIAQGVELEQAAELVAARAEELEPKLASKKFDKSNQGRPPPQQMKRFARTLGIDPGFLDHASLAARIDLVFASHLLDNKRH